MTIKIELYRNGVYNAGGHIEGKVICDFNVARSIQGIFLEVEGHEHTSWTKEEKYYDSETKKDEEKTVKYHGNNKFFFIRETVCTGFINFGHHEFPFRIPLPKKLPSTYKCSNGDIRYCIRVFEEIPIAQGHRVEKIFTVKSPIDFNDLTYNLELNPTQYQDEKSLWCCCCASDPITLEAYLEKEAFVVGEVIRIKLKINNMSNTSTQKVKVELKRTINTKCTEPKNDEKEDTTTVLTNEDTGVGAHGNRDYHFELHIPSGFKLSNFAKSNLFSQKFALKIEVTISGCHTNMVMEIPVKLGHIGVSGHTNTKNSFESDSANITFTPLPAAPLNAPPPYPSGLSNNFPGKNVPASIHPYPPSQQYTPSAPTM